MEYVFAIMVVIIVWELFNRESEEKKMKKGRK